LIQEAVGVAGSGSTFIDLFGGIAYALILVGISARVARWRQN
jgi:hypothetical protein